MQTIILRVDEQGPPVQHRESKTQYPVMNHNGGVNMKRIDMGITESLCSAVRNIGLHSANDFTAISKMCLKSLCEVNNKCSPFSRVLLQKAYPCHRQSSAVPHFSLRSL